MRSELTTFLAALMFATPATLSAETILQNDSLEMDFNGTTSAARLIAGEMYEAVFEIPEEMLPVEMLGVRVVMVRDPTAGVNPCGRFGIDVWEEGSNLPQTDNCIIANVRYKDPGAQLFTQDSVIDPQTSTVLGFEVRGDDTRGNATFKDLRFSAINQVQGVTINPVVIESSPVRVAVRALDLQCTAGGMIGSGDHFPVLISDLDNVGRPLSNFVYGIPDLAGTPICTSGMEQHYAWEDFGPAFQMSQPGDFIMRLILDFDDPNNPDPDMGMPDMGMSSDMGMSMDTGMSSDMNAPPFDIGTNGMNNANNTNGNNTNGNNGVGAGLVIDSVTPDSGSNDSSTDIAIVGSGFVDGLEVLLDATKIGVTEVQSGRINATVPDGFEAGSYDLVVTNPNGDTDILMDGFEVVEPGEADRDGGTSGGCCAQVPAASDASGHRVALLLVLIGLAIGTRRQRFR